MSHPSAITLMNQPTPAVVPGACVAMKRDGTDRHEHGMAGGSMR